MCPFCDPAVVVQSNGAWFSMHDKRDGHLLLIPWRHVRRLTDLAPEEAAQLPEFLKSVLASGGINRYRLRVNGPGYQHVEHFHVHLLASEQKHQ